MATGCKACAHPDRLQIDAELVSGVPIRTIATKYGLVHTSLIRHKANHTSGGEVVLAEARRELQVIREEHTALNVAETLGTILQRARLLSNACDKWLRDPLNEAEYFVGPRTDEVTVIHETLECGEDGKVRRHREREPLSVFLARVEEGLGGQVVRAEVRHSDIRELVLKAQAGSLTAVETVAALITQSFELQGKLDAAARFDTMDAGQVESELRTLLCFEGGLDDAGLAGVLSLIERGAQLEAEQAAEVPWSEEEQ